MTGVHMCVGVHCVSVHMCEEGSGYISLRVNLGEGR